MRANYHCPDCHGRLVDAGAASAWRCRRCETIVVETSRRVREFFRRACGWSR